MTGRPAGAQGLGRPSGAPPHRLPGRHDRGGTVYQITDTRLSRAEEISGRQTRYLVSMGIRTGCFLGAIVADGWLRWVLFVGAILLPYISVIIANAGRESAPSSALTMVNLDRRALPPGVERDVEPRHRQAS